MGQQDGQYEKRLRRVCDSFNARTVEVPTKAEEIKKV